MLKQKQKDWDRKWDWVVVGIEVEVMMIGIREENGYGNGNSYGYQLLDISYSLTTSIYTLPPKSPDPSDALLLITKALRVLNILYYNSSTNTSSIFAQITPLKPQSHPNNNYLTLNISTLSFPTQNST